MERRRCILLSVAMTPCLASLVAWMSPAAPASIAAGAPKAPLAFSQYAVNWKETRSVATVRAHFNFRNCSDDVVRITGIRPSCGCVIPDLVGKKRTYGPGEAGRLELVLPTANEEPGRHEYTIAVAYNDGVDRTTNLKFNVELPAKSVRLEPSELYFYQYGEPLSRTMRVVDDRNKLLDVTDVRIEYFRGRENAPEPVPVELADATIEPTEVTADGKRSIPIRIDVAGDLDPKEKIAHLVITTSDPDFRTLKVPMLIQPRPVKTPVQQSSVPPVPGL